MESWGAVLVGLMIMAARDAYRERQWTNTSRLFSSAESLNSDGEIQKEEAAPAPTIPA